jgi:Fic family protein
VSARITATCWSAPRKGTLDVTRWLSWFLGALERAIVSARVTLDAVLVKARFWQRWSGTPLSERQVKVLNRVLDGLEGKLTSSK